VRYVEGDGGAGEAAEFSHANEIFELSQIQGVGRAELNTLVAIMLECYSC
jgi:hypothetical protein